MRQLFCNILFLLTAVAAAGASERRDTTFLSEVEVVADAVKTDVIPVQKLSGEELKRLNSNSVADALRYFSGLQVKDYGGVGGIKTVNIRSMGTNHSGIVYDGIELGNAQNGQIDLGQFSLDNMEELSVYNGQRSAILQPARDFTSAGNIYMRTRTPRFSEGERFHLRASVRTGSFGLINPAVLAEVKLTQRINVSASAEWTCANGKYKFRYRKVNAAGKTVYDTTAVRHNGDVNALRFEANVNGSLNAGQWNAKIYTYNSERGIPGAIVSNVWRRGERQWDSNSFAQASLTQSFGRFTTLNNVKYAFYKTHYVNNDARQLKIDNRFRQQEVYLSTANELLLLPGWRLSASYDFQWNTLWADMNGFAHPDRFTHTVAGATSLDFGGFRAQASVAGTFVHDVLHGRKSPADRRAFTPALLASYDIPRGFSVRAYVKQSFRMPTFNDLYYTDMGNSKLDPEKVTQYNLGLLYERRGRGFLAAARASADAYYNLVSNKIVAYPKGQQFRWTMLNLGKVDIRGIDVSALLTVKPAEDLFLTLRGQYTFQRAIDITSRKDSYYRHQIPYIPRHSGSVVFNAGWRLWSLNYSFIYAGERYSQQENISYNYLAPWYTHDISISRDFSFGRTRLRALLEVNNIFGMDYEVIVNYPMPKQNFRLSLTVEL